VTQNLRASFLPFHIDSTLPDTNGLRIESQTARSLDSP